MMRFLRKLWGDRRGNVLVITAMVMPLLVGAAGLATDTIMWSMWKRELQRAADSAAFAGVYAKIQADPNVTAEQAVNADLLKHNTTGVALVSGYPVIEYPTVHQDAVKVTLAVQRRLGFSSLFLSTPPVIITTATAARVIRHNYCLIGLSPTGSALNIGGSSYVDMGCGAFSNSEHTDLSVNVMGNDHYFSATVIDSAGGIDGPINGTDEVNEEMSPAEDPYAGLDTSVPAGMTCTPITHSSKIASQTGSVGTGDLHVTLQPGCYSNFSTSNGLYTLNPGTYYLDSTNLTLQGSTRLVGEGVTIVLTGTTPGRVANNGTSSFELTAPTTGAFAGLVLVQSANATVGNNNFINGDNGTLIDGGMYFPVGDLTINGNTGQATQCISLVAYTVTFSGNAYVQNDAEDCEADNQYDVEKVRLIA